ncbi:MAG: SDR family NAD(P)-dependent oxidoreductase [Nocardioides sp.]|uniref:SDR family NAD(P)-dependent oxidoreductase n=1 Tax=Nocardioides sp. TaxID=35761 RepID=UPI0039E5CDAF
MTDTFGAPRADDIQDPRDLLDLTGKTAVVTGGSSGLGVGIALGLAKLGANVCVTGRREPQLVRTVEEISAVGAMGRYVVADVSREDHAHTVVEQTLDSFGSVDVLVNNAGRSGAAPATRESSDHFRVIVETNLHGTYWMCQAVGRVMAPGSAIVNISSVLALTSAVLPQAAYASSKAGVLGLTRDLAHQWTGRKGIRVNAVAPGWFGTEMTAEMSDDMLRGIVDQRVLAGRLGSIAELVSAVCFLSTPASSYISGVVLPVDGGVLTN